MIEWIVAVLAAVVFVLARWVPRLIDTVEQTRLKIEFLERRIKAVEDAVFGNKEDDAE